MTESMAKGAVRIQNHDEAEHLADVLLDGKWEAIPTWNMSSALPSTLDCLREHVLTLLFIRLAGVQWMVSLMVQSTVPAPFLSGLSYTEVVNFVIQRLS